MVSALAAPAQTRGKRGPLNIHSKSIWTLTEGRWRNIPGANSVPGHKPRPCQGRKGIRGRWGNLSRSRQTGSRRRRRNSRSISSTFWPLRWYLSTDLWQMWDSLNASLKCIQAYFQPPPLWLCSITKPGQLCCEQSTPLSTDLPGNWWRKLSW